MKIKYIIFTLLLLLIFLCICIYNIKKVNEYFVTKNQVEFDENQSLFKSIKSLKYKDKNDQIKEDEVYFYLQKVNNQSYDYWYNFAKNQEINSSRLGAFDDRKNQYIPIIDGVSSFLTNLDLLYKINSNKESLYIAYVSRKDDIDSNLSNSNYLNENVEMCFGVFCSEQSPIVTHMGIFRNYQYFLKRYNPHLNLATQLHSFAAKCESLMKGVPKMYICTRPADQMKDIFIKLLSNIPNAIYIGSNKERKELLDNFLIANSLKDKIDTIDTKDIIEINEIAKTIFNNKKFNEYESIQETINRNVNYYIKKTKKLIDFTNEEICDKTEDKYKRYEKNKIIENIIDIIPESLHNNFNFILNDFCLLNDTVKFFNSLDNLKTILPNYFLLDEIKDKINKSENRLIRKEKSFIPSNIKQLTPLNNFELEWQIINPETKEVIINFNKPVWFSHEHLNNHLDMTIIDIPILSSFF